MKVTIRCTVPHCRRTMKCDAADSESVCSSHYILASAEARAEYEAAWKEADKADKRAADGLEVPDSVYVRVTSAWFQLRAEAIEMAAALR